MIGPVALIMSVLAGSPHQGQSDEAVRAQTELRLIRRGDWPLPSGDTLVEFSKWGPIHSVVVSGGRDAIASAMVRNDGLTGWAASTWSGAQMTSFSVRWQSGQRTTLEIGGRVRGTWLLLSGTRSDSVRIPERPWGVADAGMEDQLTPLLVALPHDRSQRVAVWRPLADRWETLVVHVKAVDGFLVVSQDQSTWVIAPDGRLLLMWDHSHNALRRPLADGRRSQEFEKAARIVGYRL